MSTDPLQLNGLQARGLASIKTYDGTQKSTSSSTKAKTSDAMVDEDLWDLGEKWKALSEKSNDTTRTNEEALKNMARTPSKNPTLKKTNNNIQIELNVRAQLLK
jgi:multimeric flavodoxin WrbA